jgi:fimbrial chaperone protein
MIRRTLLLKQRMECVLKFVIAAFALCFGTVCAAAGLQVSPTMLEFKSGDTARSVWLSNTSDTVLHAQVRILSWSQHEGSEQLEPSRSLVASPPLLEVAPGERQLVRIVRLDAGEQPVELAFRLLIDELPQGTEHPVAQGLNFLLQYSLPVFVMPGASTAPNSLSPQLSTALVRGGAASAEISVHNTGTHRARLSDLVWEDAQGERTSLRTGLLGYVLAGQQMTFPFKLPSSSLLGKGTLKAIVNDDRGEQELLALDGAN